MAVFKKHYAVALPANAERFERNKEPWARWKAANGKKREGKLSACGGKVLLESATWTAKYRDGRGRIVERTTECRTREGAERKLAEFEAAAERVRCGLVTAAEADTIDWQAMPFSRHVADYEAHLRGQGRTESHIKDRKRCLDVLATDCRFVKLADVNRAAFERWQAVQREKGRGARSTNSYREALMAFCNWCLRAGRLAVNPIVGVTKINERTDKRHHRRALTEAEMLALLEAARTRPLHEALTKHRGKKDAKLSASTRATLVRLGKERELIYKTLLLTGLRRGELASIKISSVQIEGARPYLVLDAKDEKSRRGAQIALRADLATELKSWMSERQLALREAAKRAGKPIPARLPGDAKLFDVPDRWNLRRILDEDRAFGKIAEKDERDAVVDVHALRLTFCTHLHKAGVSLRTAQLAMRHSTPTLTANIYTDTALLDVAGALDKLPALKGPKLETAKAVAQADEGVSDHAPDHAPTPGSPVPFCAAADQSRGAHASQRSTRTRGGMVSNDRPIRVLSTAVQRIKDGGRCRARTCDPLGVNQVL